MCVFDFLSVWLNPFLTWSRTNSGLALLAAAESDISEEEGSKKRMVDGARNRIVW